MLRRGMLIALAGVLTAVLIAPAAGTALAQRKGGTVHWFLYGDPGALDFFTEATLGVQQATAGIYSGLLQYSPDEPGKIVPDLAVSYRASNGGKTYTFKLRQGVKWHDDEPFSAADVKATFDHMMDPEVKARRCGSLMHSVLDKVTEVDASTVRFDLRIPAVTFIPALASAWCRIAAKHILEEYGNLQDAEAQIGTGPFILKRYERGNVIEWRRNPDYYNPKYPHLDSVKQFILVGTARQLAAAKAGQVHLWENWPPMSKSTAEAVKAARGDAVEVYRWPINTVWALHLNPNKPPFDQKDIRRAVHLALNRQELIENGFEGAGTPCAILDPKLYGDWALPMDEVLKMPGCRPDKTADLDEARRLVAKNFPDGADFEIVARTVGNYVDRVQLVVEDLKKVGLRGKLKTYESAAGYSVYSKGDFAAIGTQDTAFFLPDPSAIFSTLYTSDAGRNWQKAEDSRLDKWAAAALLETDEASRRELYHKMQRHLLSEDNATPVVGWVDGWFFQDTALKNYRRANTIYDNNTLMNVWLDQ